MLVSLSLFSFLVVIIGDRCHSQLTMSPLRPFEPFWPGAPAPPLSPSSPGGPVGPGGPGRPREPGIPSRPIEPGTPMSPWRTNKIFKYLRMYLTYMALILIEISMAYLVSFWSWRALGAYSTLTSFFSWRTWLTGRAKCSFLPLRREET